MHIEHHPFVADHPEWAPKVHILKLENSHFARLLGEYEWLDKEICRAEDGIEGYHGRYGTGNTQEGTIGYKRYIDSDGKVSIIKIPLWTAP